MTNIYLAGKIAKNDWRHEIVTNLRDWVHETEQYWEGGNIQDLWEWPTLPNSVFAQFSYVGPFFIGCDHGCYHGQNSHGYEDNGCGSEGTFSRKQVTTLCKVAIQKCDLFFAWIDTTDCYGTIVEIGYAASLGKRVLIAGPHQFDDMWFVYEMAEETNFEYNKPSQALKMWLGLNEIKIESSRDNILESIANTVRDYRLDEIAPITPQHIETWVSQFPEDMRFCILTEMDRILGRYYMSRKIAADRLATLIHHEPFFGSNPVEILRNTKFLSIQRHGNSQNDLLNLINDVLLSQFGLALSDCGKHPQQYIYLDDGLFTGNSALYDCREWMQNAVAVKGSILHFIFFATHASGLSYLQKKIKPHEIQYGISTKYWTFLPLQDRKGNIESYWPVDGMYTEQVKQYNELLCQKASYSPRLFRPENLPLEETIFSSIEARNIVTSAFLEAGVSISMLSQNGKEELRPLGYEKLASLGFGSFFVSYRNIPNNAPLALWWGNPEASPENPLSKWYPLFRRKGN